MSTALEGVVQSLARQQKKRLDDYKALAPDENSQELDGKALYTMGQGMAHGRVPIGDGVVEKRSVLVHAKSRNVKPISPDHYQSVLKENEKLKEDNEILCEENSINRDLTMWIYAELGKEPPADLLQRLANLEACRHQTTGSAHAGDDTQSLDSDDDEDCSWHASYGDLSLEGDADDDDLESDADYGDEDNDGEDLEGDGDGDDLEGDGDGILVGDADHAGSKDSMAIDGSGRGANN